MLIQPVDRVPRELDERGPLLDRHTKLQVRGARIRYTHKHAPKDHGDARIKQEQQTYRSFNRVNTIGVRMSQRMAWETSGRGKVG